MPVAGQATVGPQLVARPTRLCSYVLALAHRKSDSPCSGITASLSAQATRGDSTMALMRLPNRTAMFQSMTLLQLAAATTVVHSDSA